MVNLTIPDNLESQTGENGTYWKPVVAGHRQHDQTQKQHHGNKPEKSEHGMVSK